MSMRALAGSLAVAAVIGLAACSGEPTALETGPIVGPWTLVEINGQPLPISELATFEDNLCTFTLSEFNVEFRSNRRYTGNDVVTRTCGGVTTNIGRSYNGTWRISGDVLFMREGAGVEFASLFDIADDTLTITGDDDGEAIVQVLVRQ